MVSHQTDRLEIAPLQYLIFDKAGRQTYCSEAFSETFPIFASWALKKMSFSLVREFLECSANVTDLFEPSAQSNNRPKIDGKLGVYEFDGDIHVAIDYMVMNADFMLVFRDITAAKNAIDNNRKYENSVTLLANKEAIYTGKKEEGFQALTSTVREVLDALFADLWLLNIDGSKLHLQCRNGGSVEDSSLKTVLSQAECASLFSELEKRQPVLPATDLKAEWVRVLCIENAGLEDVSLAVVPVCRGPRVIGALIVGRTHAGCFAEQGVSFLKYAAETVLRILDGHDRRVAEEGLRGFNELLEIKVNARTEKLEKALESLKVTQEELIRSEKMASLGGLVAGVAHEINTPLGVAMTTISHLAHELKIFKENVRGGKIKMSSLNGFVDIAEESATVAGRNLERAAHLIRSFKMVAVDQSADDHREINLAAYLGEVIESLTPALRKSGVKVNVTCLEEIIYTTIPGDLSHVLTNLVMNSATHAFTNMAAKNEKLIHINLLKSADQLTISVADNGKGIPDEHKEKIFEPFFTTARNTGGSGLGLNIVYNTIYQKMKGSISVNNAVGGGALFEIKLPISP